MALVFRLMGHHEYFIHLDHSVSSCQEEVRVDSTIWIEMPGAVDQFQQRRGCIQESIADMVNSCSTKMSTDSLISGTFCRQTF